MEPTNPSIKESAELKWKLSSIADPLRVVSWGLHPNGLVNITIHHRVTQVQVKGSLANVRKRSPRY